MRYERLTHTHYNFTPETPTIPLAVEQREWHKGRFLGIVFHKKKENEKEEDETYKEDEVSGYGTT